MRLLFMVLTLAVLLAVACGKEGGVANGGADGDADGDADSDTETDTDTDTLLPTPECAEDGDCAAPLICNELWGLCVVADCSDQDDFTPCKVVTDPDRAYDICIRGVCRSPGCGTVDCNPPGPHFPLGDSGQRYCTGGHWGGAEVLDECPAPGEDFHGQDAQFGWDTLHDHSERYTRTVPVPDEPIVVDHATGLIWQGCDSYTRGADCEEDVPDMHVTWQQALAYCDSLIWGGYRDWRLPDRWEIESLLLDLEGDWRYCDEEAFPRCNGNRVWTISMTARTLWESDWAIESLFSRGDISLLQTFKYAHARCVRGLPNPRPRERWERDTSVPDQSVVHDHWTGLVWQGCPRGLVGDDCGGEVERVTWKDALGYCASLSDLAWGGRDDWRLPGRHELSSIVDHRFLEPAVDPEVFPAMYAEDSWLGGGTWTSTSIWDTYESIAILARGVFLKNGMLPEGGKLYKDFFNLVICVAGDPRGEGGE